jgi:pimeloyl-ACP methyl ester carboxylesterase
VPDAPGPRRFDTLAIACLFEHRDGEQTEGVSGRRRPQAAPKPTDRISHWVSPEAQRRFLAAYDELARLWPSPPEPAEIETTFGSTHVVHWPGSGRPIVLLHGWGVTSLMWQHLVHELDDHDLYAIDAIGDAGRSVQRAPLEHGSDFATWLDEVFSALALDDVLLVGLSFGGFLALNQGLRSPSRLAAIVAIEPAGLAKLSPRFYSWGLACGLAAWAPGWLRRRCAVWLRHGGLNEPALLRMTYLGMLKHRARVPLPWTPLSDEELRSISVPTLLLMGEKSQIYRTPVVLTRLRSLAPQVTADVVPDVGHTLGYDEAAAVATAIRRVLAT